MKTTDVIKIAFFIVFASLIFAAPTKAQYGQYGQVGYGGGGPVQMILIDKTVGNPVQTKGGTNLDFVDNLSSSDVRFKPGQEVMFRLKVKNTSSVRLSQVQVRDFLPSFTEALEGPGQITGQTISFNAGDFNAGEEKTFFIKARLFSNDKMPTDKGLFCLVNKAEALADSTRDEDSAQFCVEKEVLGAVNVPAAGPEAGAILILGELLALGAGLSLIRK